MDQVHPRALFRYLNNANYQTTGGYDWAKVSTRETKRLANVLFRDSIPSLPGRIVYLDADDANTTNHLHSFTATHELVAVNMHTRACAEIVCNRQVPVAVFCGTLAEFIQTAAASSVSALWMDYCSTFDGCTQTSWSPKNDFKNALERQIVCKGGVVAMTVCTRTGTKGVSVDNIGAWLLRTARKTYSKSTMLQEYAYTGMHLFILRLA